MEQSNIESIIQKCDYVILGAGPAGLSAADCLVSSGLHVAIIDRGLSTKAYYSATGKYELIRGMQAGGIGGATQQWGGQLLRLGKAEYFNWSRHDGFNVEILADLEKETEAILRKFKVQIPKFNGYAAESHANVSSCSSCIPKEKDLSSIFKSTISSPFFHYIEGLEISSIEKKGEVVSLKTSKNLSIDLDKKTLLLALGTIENTVLLAKSISNFTNQTFDNIGRNLQDHPHGVIFEVESNLFNWYRNYFFLRLNKNSQKKKFEYSQSYGKFIRGGIAEIHPIDSAITFRDELKGAIAERSFVKLMKFNLRVLSTISLKTLGKKLYFERAGVWFQYEQKENQNSYLKISKEQVSFEWRNSVEDFEFLLLASMKMQEFFTDLGFKVTNVKTWKNLEELDEWCSDACHPSGTIPLGGDKSWGVTDYLGKVHTLPRTYLLGSSLFPTAGWINPTLLIMAYSRLVISRIKVDQKQIWT